MSTIVDRPTTEEIQAAINKAKGSPHNLTSSAIKHTDHGAGIVRHYLPKRFHSWPLDEVRIACENLSKAGGEPGKRKRTEQQKQDGTLKSLVKAFPSNGEHSPEYDRIHESDEFKSLRDARKIFLDYRCQLCCRHFMGQDLEGHILDYDTWDMPGMMIILCRDECHPIADALRRRGKKMERGDDLPPMLF